MVEGNVIFLNPSKEFTPKQRAMIDQYVKSYDNYLRSRATLVYGYGDEGHEFCSVTNEAGCVFAHYAKTDTNYIADCTKFGYRQSATLMGVLIHQGTPREVIQQFEDNRKAQA